MAKIDAQKIVRDLAVFWYQNTALTPQAINEGSCYMFAEDLLKELPGAVVIWNDEYDHAYVNFEGRIYDAEAPEGVRDYRQLPAIKRQRV